MRRLSEASAMVAPPVQDFDGAFQSMVVSEASTSRRRSRGQCSPRPARNGRSPPASPPVSAWATGRLWATTATSPAKKAWTMGEWRRNGEPKYYLGNLPPDTPLRRCAMHSGHQGALGVRAGAPAAQAGAGPRPLRGPLRTGLHRHALMTCIAFAWLQHLRLKTVRRRGQRAQAALGRWTAAASEPALRAPRHHGKALRCGSPDRSDFELLPRNHRRRPAVNHNGNHCR